MHKLHIYLINLHPCISQEQPSLEIYLNYTRLETKIHVRQLKRNFNSRKIWQWVCMRCPNASTGQYWICIEVEFKENRIFLKKNIDKTKVCNRNSG